MFEGLRPGGRGQSVAVCLWSFLVALCMVTQITTSWAQTTIHVPSDQPTIQAGINAASNGDTVLVAPGTYTENIDFEGKAITVTSGATTSAGAASTIINGNQHTPAVVLQTNETRASVLNGFTIQNGQTGVYLANSSATISNNLITGNVACGIAAAGQNAGPLITGNHISNTRPILNVQCLPSGQPYSNDNAAQEATAIWLEEAGTVEITGNLIDNNGALVPSNVNAHYGPEGAGVYSQTLYGLTTILVTNNVIHNNYEDLAPPISIMNAVQATVTQNLIYANLNGLASGPSVAGILVTDNAYYGPRNTIFSEIVVNNTIYGNTNQVDTTGLPPSGDQARIVGYQQTIKPLIIENNLFIATQQYGTVSCSVDPGDPIVYSNNDAFYANASEPSRCQGTGSGNLTIDPEFLAPSTGNFFTQRTSPVVAAGDAHALSLPATDLAGKNRTVCGTVDIGVYEIHPIPAISLSSSPNPSVGGSSITINGAVAGNCNVPTGVLTFYSGSTMLGTANLNSNGTATFSTAALTVGSDTITATYPGDFNFDPSTSSPLIQVVTGYPTATSLQVSPNPAKAFQPITLTAAVTSQFGVPNGTISFYSGTTLLTSAIVNGSGIASATLSSLGAGSYFVTAVYNASINYASSTSPVILLKVDGATTGTTLSSIPNPSVFGQVVTFSALVAAPQASVLPTGTVSFSEGATILGTSPLSPAGAATFSSGSLSVGRHLILATYNGSPNDNTSTSNFVTQTVGLAPVTVSLTSSLNPANLGQSVTFVASVSATTAGAATSGTVTFADQFGVLQSVPLSGGQALYTTSSLSAGTHNITATFSNGGNFAGGVSVPLAELIQMHDFALTLSQPSLSIPAGQKMTLTVQLASIGNFSGTPSLTAAQLPANASAKFSPASVALPSGGTLSSVLTIDTANLPPGVASIQSVHTGVKLRGSITLAALFALPLMVLRRRRTPALLALLAAVALLTSTVGCTNISFPIQKVAPGTYVIPITATDSNSQITHTTNLTLTITP